MLHLRQHQKWNPQCEVPLSRVYAFEWPTNSSANIHSQLCVTRDRTRGLYMHCTRAARVTPCVAYATVEARYCKLRNHKQIMLSLHRSKVSTTSLTHMRTIILACEPGHQLRSSLRATRLHRYGKQYFTKTKYHLVVLFSGPRRIRMLKYGTSCFHVF